MGHLCGVKNRKVACSNLAMDLFFIKGMYNGDNPLPSVQSHNQQYNTRQRGYTL